MFSVQDHFPGTFPDTFSRDGFRYNFRDVPQTRFAVTFSGGVFGDVSGYVVFGCVSSGVLRNRVSCTASVTFFRYVFPETFCQSRSFGRGLRRFQIRLQMRLPEPFPQSHFPGTFFGDVSSATFLPLWRGLLDV